MRVEDFPIASAKALPDKIALTAGEGRLTFDDLGHESDGIAASLVSHGDRDLLEAAE